MVLPTYSRQSFVFWQPGEIAAEKCETGMTKNRAGKERIVAALKEYEAGCPMAKAYRGMAQRGDLL